MDDNTTDPDAGPERGRPWTMALLAVIAAAVVVIAVLLALDAFRDDDAASPSTTAVVTVPAASTTVPASTTPVTTTPASTTPATTAASTTPATTAASTTVPAPTTAPATTTPPPTAPPIDELRDAIFPTPGMGTVYTDPVTAAREFALAIGYADPVTGEFQAGDQRSGEVEVRAAPSTLTSVVFVRQFDDQGSWYVIGAATENIEVDTPEPLEVIASPLVVTGRARSFEGTVDVLLTADDVDEPLVDDFVTGSGGPDLDTFEGTFEFDSPAVEGGALLFLSRSSEDGSVVEVGAQRVFFAND